MKTRLANHFLILLPRKEANATVSDTPVEVKDHDTVPFAFGSGVIPALSDALTHDSEPQRKSSSTPQIASTWPTTGPT